ncbi:MAG TPA: hypothetical protein VHL11_20635, partial [Phototrophicaceae bacterium]|nr:hypothetical protein [Phototrophicaceae bacterium]
MKNFMGIRSELLIRTDFSDDSAWESLCETFRDHVDAENLPDIVTLINNPEYKGLTTGKFLTLFTGDPYHRFVFLADTIALTHTEHP